MTLLRAGARCAVSSAAKPPLGVVLSTITLLVTKKSKAAQPREKLITGYLPSSQSPVFGASYVLLVVVVINLIVAYSLVAFTRLLRTSLLCVLFTHLLGFANVLSN